MRYGIGLSTTGECGDPRTMSRLARLAEESGWDGIFLEDYVFHWENPVKTFDPWIVLAAMAINTEHISLGTMVTPIARRRPWKLAREAVTIDHLSDGRLILGVGLGNSDDIDFAALGEETNAKNRATVFGRSP